MSGIVFSISIGSDNNVDCKIESTLKKTRDYKGKSANAHVDNYCVLDLETTGVFVNSAEIIEIAALKVRDNKVVDEYATLVNPECHIPAAATAVNNITDDMVKDAPLLGSVIDDFLNFVGDDVIVGYNNAGFDMNLIYDRTQSLRDKFFTNDYVDILHAVRRSLPELENAKLETVSKYYMFDITGEHRALKDCYLTKSCFDKLYEEFGDKAFKKASHKSSGHGFQYSAETLALRELQNLLKGMLEDGQITRDEVDTIRYWLEEHTELSGNYPFDKAFNALDNVLEDGRITEEELNDLKTIFTEIVDPVKSQGCNEEIRTLVEKQVCLTGEFDYGPKSAVEKLICEAGGIIDKGVKKTTHYVVVGAYGSDAWKTGNYGGKIQKAMEWNSKGQNIVIIEEKNFIPAVEYLLEHPEECNCNENEVASYDWKTPIQAMLDEMVIEEELPSNSLYLMANYGRDNKTITSYSVCIYEPDYPSLPNSIKDPARNSIVINIKEKETLLELLISEVQYGDIGAPTGAEIKELKSDKINVHALLPSDSPELVEYIKKSTKYAYANYVSKASSFGCCSRYNECSDARRCIHPNKLFGKACMYRKNLDAGRIFYGKNRNID